jgi:hypothetical protein
VRDKQTVRVGQWVCRPHRQVAANRLGGTEFLHSDKGVPVSRDQARLPRSTVQIAQDRAEPLLFGPACSQHPSMGIGHHHRRGQRVGKSADDAWDTVPQCCPGEHLLLLDHTLH